MTRSMTGFGVANTTVGPYTITTEIKSLNSKFADIILRIPSQISAKELEIRKLITDYLTRGKISVIIEIVSESTDENFLNKELFEKYYEVYESVANSVHAEKAEIFKLALQAPGVINSNGHELPEEIVDKIPQVVQEALKHCNDFREQEGKELESKLREYIDSIQKNLQIISALDSGRAERVAERLKNSLANLNLDVDVDKNRFEQELIYYIEKFDINEEKVRLANHLKYFLEILDSDDSNGKKLGFISQEIGREINTIGSKANDSDIQKHVVLMKEELEKIKEQSLNIL